MTGQEGYRSVSLPDGLIGAVEEYIHSNPKRGYKSVSDFVRTAVRLQLEEILQHWKDVDTSIDNIRDDIDDVREMINRLIEGEKD